MKAWIIAARLCWHGAKATFIHTAEVSLDQKRFNQQADENMPFPDKLETFEEFCAFSEELARLLPGDGVEHDAIWLSTELAESHALFTRDGKHTRVAAQHALDAAIKYIEDTADLPLTRQALLLAPLHALSSALDQLNDGVVESLLEPASKDIGAPSLTFDELQFRFVVAYAACAKAAQCNRNDACKLMADELKKLGFKKQRQQRSGNSEPITDVTVRNWIRDMPRLWARIRAQSGLTLEQYLFRISSLASVSATALKGPDLVHHSLLRMIPQQFGHLAE